MLHNRQSNHVLLAFLVLALSRGGNDVAGVATGVPVRGSASVQTLCAFSSRVAPYRSRSRHHKRVPSTSASPKAIAEEDAPSAKQRRQHPSQPRPDYGTRRQAPIFPGAVPVQPHDITTCINQIGQTEPANVLLGKPRQTRCKHGYAQAFSLNPMPQQTQRLNSGLMKLTCPLLVNSIDVLEDDGFMKEVNGKLVENAEWMECMSAAHRAHSAARKELIFGAEDTSDAGADAETMHVLESKLGQHGASFFLDAGVAGANPLQGTVDVKCLHAWMADALFRASATADEHESAGRATTDHLIGDAIAEALADRGIDVAGTDTCHEVCSGCCQQSAPASGANRLSVHVPHPTNKQRKKRRASARWEAMDSEPVLR